MMVIRMSTCREFTLTAADSTHLSCYEWPVENARATVVMLHGLAEHAARYGRFAAALNEAGFSALSMDLRGHGQSANGRQGWFAAKDGWLVVLEDIRRLAAWARDNEPGKPLVLFGHSLGSVFAQAALQRFGGLFQAAVLSGVSVDVPLRRNIAPLIARVMGALRGMGNPSPVLDGLTFGAYNKQFEPARTKFDWLSRDTGEVDKYVADPACGFVCTGSLFVDVSRLLLDILKPARVAGMPKDVPMLIISGAKDPVGLGGQTAAFLEKRYRTAGLDVAAKVYPEARHELLNEMNREEVTGDIIMFIEKSVSN